MDNDTAPPEPPDRPIRAHLRSSAGCFAAIITFVFLLGVITAWNKGIGFLLLLLSIIPIPIALLLGGAILSYQGAKLALGLPISRSNKAALFIAAPAMLIVTVVMLLPSLAGGTFAGTAARLLLNQRHYEAIIEAELRRSSVSTGHQTADGITYLVDRGPPLRVAFNPEGMLDNWSGIIFDPTHQVMLADGMDREGRFRAPRHVTELFGGDLVDCRHLWGDYFYCGFT